jgi:hypothetical protein
MFRPLIRLAGPAFVFTLAIAACGENSSPVGDSGNAAQMVISNVTVGVPDSGEFEICKYGSAASFDYSVNGGAVSTVGLADGGCAVLATTLALGPGQWSVTVTEQADATIVLDSLVATINTIRDIAGVRGAPITGTSTFTGGFNGDRGVLVEFYNSPVPPPPPPGDGCTFTQGYWKNHTNVWPAPYSPSATFYTSGKTWLGVLNTPVRGNVYYIVAYQFIAATLNGANDASVPANIATAMNTAAGYFANPGGTTLTTAELTALGALLDSYNNGLQGVPHCP